MKKQMTILAAAAILATFATAASAASVPTISMGGNLDYAVEYNLLDRTWTNPAEAGLGAGALSFSVATAGNPNLGTVTFAAAGFGMAPAVTISGTVGTVGVKLGQVAADWDTMSANTGNPGAALSRTFGAAVLEVATTSNVPTNTDVVNAARATLTLGSASIAGGVVVDPVWEGLGYLVASSKLGPAKLTAKAGKLLGGSGASALFGKVELPVGNVKLLAKVAIAPATYVHPHLSAAPGTGSDAGDMEHLGWVALQSTRNLAGKPNVFVRADLTVAPGVAPYGEFDYKANGDFAAKAGTSFAPLYVTNAFAKFSTAAAVNTTEFFAGLGKGAISAFVGYKIVGLGVGDTQAEVKLSKTLDGWLNTYASVGKAYAATVPYIRIGASASKGF